jgi:hypothetical protein
VNGEVWVETTQPTVWSGVTPEGDNGILKEHKKENKKESKKNAEN